MECGSAVAKNLEPQKIILQLHIHTQKHHKRSGTWYRSIVFDANGLVLWIPDSALFYHGECGSVADC